MPFNTRKFFLKSKTILLALPGLAVVLGPMFDLQISSEEGVMFTQLADSIVTTVSLFGTIWGRFVASEKVTISPTSK